MKMSSRTPNRQVFVVEDDDPIDDYTRKPSQEEFLPRRSKQSGRMSVKDFPSFRDGSSATKPFYKTPKGIAIIVACSVIGGLIILGGIIGLAYYLGVSLNTKTVNVASTGIADPSSVDSSIMTTAEKSRLISFGSFKTFSLLYRASRDGFFMNVFHRQCDNRVQTVSVIRSHMNSVFGGYTAQTWNSINGYKTDTTAFLFSLRRRGIANSERFNVSNSGNAVYAAASYGPTFGSGHDIYICENADISQCSTSNYCSTYQCPSSVTTANMYLAGVQTFNVTEIEVYQVTF